MAANGKNEGRSRNVKAHILNLKHIAEKEKYKGITVESQSSPPVMYFL